jgi:ABC-type uncharacterized transport system involved in gliding motility auxiliary subunit
MFCAINIAQNIGKSVRLDVTDQKLYTLSNGTLNILGKVQQPVKLKLFYTRTAVMKAPDQIRFFNSYYYFVESLLQEYAKSSKGKVELVVIDPRPYSDEEAEALRYGIKKFPISEEENFFFGLVVQTQFGVTKSIPFFSPDRQNFVEYDISYLIDTAMTRQKKRIGVLSSLPVMGDEMTGYMAQMMQMQGQQPKPAWNIIQQLRQQYEVSKIEATADEIKDVDILMVIHPKNLEEKTLFAIDQFVLKGGRMIVCVDPHSVVDRPSKMEMQMMRTMPSSGSDLNRLLAGWGVEMPEKMFAGDRGLALDATLTQDARPEKIIGFLQLTRDCMNSDSVITANLNQVRMLFAGVLKASFQDPNDAVHHIQVTPLIQTTALGNSWKGDQIEMMLQYAPSELNKQFTDGTKPVMMGYLLSGRFKSNFPNGIDVPIDANKPDEQGATADANAAEKKPATKHIAGLKDAAVESTVVVFSDVDFISDIIAYQRSFFGASVVGDNAAMVMNTVEDLTGSTDLIAMRSRGSFQRPFVVVDKIEQEAEKQTSQEEAAINAQIAGFQQDLQKIVSSAKEGEDKLIETSILEKKKEVEGKIHDAQRKLKNVQRERLRSIEQLGDRLRNINTWLAPAAILVVAIVLGIRRSVRRRHYISHASDS